MVFCGGIFVRTVKQILLQVPFDTPREIKIWCRSPKIAPRIKLIDPTLIRRAARRRIELEEATGRLGAIIRVSFQYLNEVYRYIPVIPNVFKLKNQLQKGVA